MPTKRRFILFLIVLTAMLLIKRAVGQEAGLASGVYTFESDVKEDIYATIVFGVLFGVLSGIARAFTRNAAADYFSGDLVMLRIRP